MNSSHKYRGYIVLFLFISMLMNSCKRDSDLPLVRTGIINVENNSEIELKGLFENMDADEYGFEIKETVSEKVLKVEADKLKDNTFRYILSSNIYEKVKYACRAYVIGNGKEVYGDFVYFEVDNINKPEILSVSPKIIYYNDTITLRGKKFGFIKEDLKISVDYSSKTYTDIALQKFSDTLVSFVLPKDITNENRDFKINLGVLAKNVSVNTTLRPAEIVFREKRDTIYASDILIADLKYYRPKPVIKLDENICNKDYLPENDKILTISKYNFNSGDGDIKITQDNNVLASYYLLHPRVVRVLNSGGIHYSDTLTLLTKYFNDKCGVRIRNDNSYKRYSNFKMKGDTISIVLNDVPMDKTVENNIISIANGNLYGYYNSNFSYVIPKFIVPEKKVYNIDDKIRIKYKDLPNKYRYRISVYKSDYGHYNYTVEGDEIVVDIDENYIYGNADMRVAIRNFSKTYISFNFEVLPAVFTVVDDNKSVNIGEAITLTTEADIPNSTTFDVYVNGEKQILGNKFADGKLRFYYSGGATNGGEMNIKIKRSGNRSIYAIVEANLIAGNRIEKVSPYPSKGKFGWMNVSVWGEAIVGQAHFDWDNSYLYYTDYVKFYDFTTDTWREERAEFTSGIYRETYGVSKIRNYHQLFSNDEFLFLYDRSMNSFKVKKDEDWQPISSANKSFPFDNYSSSSSANENFGIIVQSKSADKIQKYDIQNDVWSAVEQSLIDESNEVVFVNIVNNKAYISFYDFSADEFNIASLDLMSDQITLLATIHMESIKGGISVCHNNKLYFVAGFNQHSAMQPSIFSFDISSNTFEQKDFSMPKMGYNYKNKDNDIFGFNNGKYLYLGVPYGGDTYHVPMYKLDLDLL